MKKPTSPTTAEKAGSPEGERIAKYLSRAGVASRREAERMIELGQVTVNGKVIDSPALNITGKERITVNGKAVAQPEPPRLWLYYKPEGLVTSNADEKGRETVFDHLPEDMPRVMSIGRLDLNSEGLLLLTNDGELKRRLELPSTGWLRKYRVRVKGNPTDADLEPLRRGITVDGEKFQPMQVIMDRHQGANAWLTVGLREGKNREIRRAMMEIGLTVNRLIRTSYGPFRLNEMEPGDVEEVRAKVLKDQLGMTAEEVDAENRNSTRTRSAPARKPAPKPAPKSDEPRRSIPRGAARKPSESAPRWLDEEMSTKPRPAAKTGAKTGIRTASSTRSTSRYRDDDDAPARRPAAPRSADASGHSSRAPYGKPAPRRDHDSDDNPRRSSSAAKPRATASRDHDAKPRSFGTASSKPQGSTHKSGAAGSRSESAKPYGKATASRSTTAKPATAKPTGTKPTGVKPAGTRSTGAKSAPRPTGSRSTSGPKPRGPRKD